jgi:hypothetical protein
VAGICFRRAGATRKLVEDTLITYLSPGHWSQKAGVTVVIAIGIAWRWYWAVCSCGVAWSFGAVDAGAAVI